MRNLKLFAPGYLSGMVEKVYSGKLKDNKDKLTTPELQRIATIYGHLAQKYDLYDLLFKQPNQMLEVDGTQVHTRDLALFTNMSHEFARSYYWKPSGTIPTDPIVCNGVPLALAGARQVFGKTYMSWIEELPKEQYIECDIFLPYGLNSYKINDAAEIERDKHPGLIIFWANKLNYTTEHIQELRLAVPNYATSYRPKVVKDCDIPDELLKAYNKASHLMRCLIIQAWVWSGPSTNKQDMIYDINDWDNHPPALDSMRSLASGLKPQPSQIPDRLTRFMI
jgi:hypothetical protein